MKFRYSTKNTKSCRKQLAVVLYRLGSKATIWDICSKFEIAEGTVPLFTSRVVEALKCLKKDIIIWPHNNYRQKVHKGFEEMCGFSNVIGILDGSHMNLLEAPSKLNKDVYFTRKHRYAVYLQAVVDHKRIFINYDLGYPASVHDTKVFRNSSLYHCRNQLFEGSNYILAYSAYPISLYIIPSFKDPSEISLILHNLLEKNRDKWEEPLEQIIMHRVQYNDNDGNSQRDRAIKEAEKIKRQNLMDIVL
ncbi:15288_t:CDS:2, partial [Gigaspora margarita]